MTLTELTPTTSLTGKWKPYPAYKDSGVEWLGEIPEHWNVKRLKHLLVGNDGGVWGDDFEEGGVIVLRSTDITLNGDWNIADPAKRRLSEADYKNAKLLANDLVVTKSSGSHQHLGKTALVTKEIEAMDCCHSNFMQRLRADTQLDPTFLHRILNCSIARDQLNYFGSTTSGLINLNNVIIGMIYISLPNLEEQHAIATFLNHETARINALIAKKEQLIKLLQEKRAALISHAVTKGLDPTVPMKDSGVEWLGEIPEHWEVKRMKYVAKQETGHTPSRQHPEYWEDCTIPWISLADVWQLRNGQKEYIEDTKEYISELGLANSSAQLLPAGTVIVSRTASVGFSGIMAHPMATTQDFANWVCGPLIRPEFLLYVFRSMEQEFRRLVMGSTHQTIYMPDIRRFITPVPPHHEQDAIVDYIRKEIAKIDALISKVREGIEKLKEYSTALISAAVTGKIDVRDEIANADEEFNGNSGMHGEP